MDETESSISEFVRRFANNKKKGLVDQIAASIILQTALENIREEK